MSNDKFKFKLNIIILYTYYILYTWQSKIIMLTHIIDILLIVFYFLIYTIKY